MISLRVTAASMSRRKTVMNAKRHSFCWIVSILSWSLVVVTTVFVQPVSSIIFEFTDSEKDYGFTLDGLEDDDKFLYRGGSTHSKKKCRTITELVCQNNEFSLLCMGLRQTGLDRTLNSSSKIWTVFAPTDEAFELLGSSLSEKVFESVENLEFVLLYHAVKNRVIYSKQLHCTHRLTMANGKETRTVCMGNMVFQNGGGNSQDQRPKIVDVDIDACNGVVHVVDRVILPVNLPGAHYKAKPTPKPIPKPTPKPQPKPTPKPQPKPTPKPQPKPTCKPTPYPTSAPTYKPTPKETPYPTLYPTYRPTRRPTPRPTPYPTPFPVPKPTPYPVEPYYPPPDPVPKPTPYPVEPYYPPPETYYPEPQPYYPEPENEPYYPLQDPYYPDDDGFFYGDDYYEPHYPDKPDHDDYYHEDAFYPEEHHEDYHDDNYHEDAHYPEDQNYQDHSSGHSAHGYHGKIDIDRPYLPCLSIGDLICQTHGLDLLCEAYHLTNLFDFLQIGYDWTVFAPTNEAMESLISRMPEGSLNVENMADLLLFQMIETSVIEFDDLQCEQWVQMSDGGYSYTHCRGFDKYQVGRGNSFQNSIIMLQDSPIILREDIGACNGIIHTVDTVLLPAWWNY